MHPFKNMTCNFVYRDGDLSLSRGELRTETKRLAVTENAFSMMDLDK